MKTKIKFLIFTIFVSYISSCTSVAGEVAVQPYGVPVKVSVNTWGEISISAEPGIEIPTPLGTATVNVIADPTKYFDVQNTLTVRLNGEDHFYDLHGQDFHIEFESGYYEQISLEKSGNDIVLELVRTSSVVSDNSENPSSNQNNPTPTVAISTPTKTPHVLPSSTPNLTDTPKIDSTTLITIKCEDALSSRLNIGDQAEVSYFQVSGRSNPGFNSRKEHVLSEGRIVKIVEGPECADRAWWWKIYFSGTVSSGEYLEYYAWMPEVDYDTYYLQKIK